jgi:hypothetical protein
MHLDLSYEEGLLLKSELTKRLDELDLELIHTDKHQLQVEISRDLKALRAVEARLADALAKAQPKAT